MILSYIKQLKKKLLLLPLHFYFKGDICNFNFFHPSVLPFVSLLPASMNNSIYFVEHFRYQKSCAYTSCVKKAGISFNAPHLWSPPTGQICPWPVLLRPLYSMLFSCLADSNLEVGRIPKHCAPVGLAPLQHVFTQVKSCRTTIIWVRVKNYLAKRLLEYWVTL